MPVLRMPQDNTLAETLGNLGQALTSNFDPLNRLRAYDVQQQIAIRQQQVIQAQRENAAKQAAIGQWGHIVPPDKLPQIANMIYQGAPYDQVARAAAQLSGNLVDDPSPAGLQKNIRYIEQITGKPYDYATLGPPVAGALTAQAANDWKVSQAGKTAASTSLGTKTGEQAANAGLNAGQIDDTTPEATANNIAIEERRTGQPWKELYPPIVGQKTGAAAAAILSGQKGAEARSTAAGTAVGGGVKPEGQLFPAGPPGSPGNPVGTAPAPPAASPTSSAAPAASSAPGAPPVAPAASPAPAAAAPVGNVSIPNPSAPFAPPTQITRQTPAGVIVGQTPTETATNTEAAKTNYTQLQQAMDEGASASRMKVKLAQLQDLEAVAGAAGASGQVSAAIQKRLADAGIVVGSQAEAYKAMDQILNTEIPELRKASGIQRLAGPEIQAVGKQIGTAQLPPGDLNNIIANESVAADIQLARRANAQNALGLGSQTMSMTDYTNADNDLNASLQARTDAQRRLLNAIGTAAPPTTTSNPAPPPPPISTQTPAPSPSIWDLVSHLFGGGDAGANPPSTPTPTPQTPPPAPPGPLKFIIGPNGQLMPQGGP